MPASNQTREIYGLNWAGVLTLSNMEQVAELFKQLLEGKTYAFIACNEGYQNFLPKVRTGQQLKGSTEAITVWRSENRKYGGIVIGDTYGVWGMDTNTDDAAYDGKFTVPYIHFEWNKVTITHRAPAGHLLYWVAAVEREVVA
jgi:hypothetical protein